jgi:hypothetical protein
MRDEIHPRPDPSGPDMPMTPDPFGASGKQPVRLAHAIHSGGFYGAEKVVCDLVREQAADSGYAPRLLALLDPGQTGNEVAERAAAQGIPVSFINASPGLSWDGLRAYAGTLINHDINLCIPTATRPRPCISSRVGWACTACP